LNVTGVVTALEFEARSLRNSGDGALIRISGIGAEHAAHAARALVAAGARALLSWGVAGALDPALECGTAVLATEVVHRGQRFASHRSWRERLLAALDGHVPCASGILLSSDVAVASTTEKARLFLATGAIAVDMESAAVAAVAVDHDLPFLALRVILDGAHDSLPAGIMRAFDPACPARPRLWPLLRAPSDWGRLLGLALRYRVARRALRACRRHADPTRAPDARAGS
jgi:adenosylhomocysteine nucleosidase